VRRGDVRNGDLDVSGRREGEEERRGRGENVC
jgi:hypothetical protein